MRGEVKRLHTGRVYVCKYLTKVVCICPILLVCRSHYHFRFTFLLYSGFHFIFLSEAANCDTIAPSSEAQFHFWILNKTIMPPRNSFNNGPIPVIFSICTFPKGPFVSCLNIILFTPTSTSKPSPRSLAYLSSFSTSSPAPVIIMDRGEEGSHEEDQENEDPLIIRISTIAPVSCPNFKKGAPSCPSGFGECSPSFT